MGANKVRDSDGHKDADELVKSASMDSEMNVKGEAARTIADSGLFSKSSIAVPVAKKAGKRASKKRTAPGGGAQASAMSNKELVQAKRMLKTLSDHVTAGKSWASRLRDASVPCTPLDCKCSRAWLCRPCSFALA